LVDVPEDKVDKQAILPALAEARATDATARRRICGLQVAEMEGWKVADAYLDITSGNCDNEALKKAKDMVAKQKATARRRSYSLRRRSVSPEPRARRSRSPRRESPRRRSPRRSPPSPRRAVYSPPRRSGYAEPRYLDRRY